MVVKSLSRTSPSFFQLLNYMAGEGRSDGTNIRHNLGSSVQSLDAVNRTFMANAKHCPKRKGGVYLYHEILSLSPEDRSQATPVMLADLAEHYLVLRAPQAMAYGVVHFDAHPHVHLMISANQRGRAKKIRCSKQGFAQMKRSLEAYQRVKYPQLSHSLVFGEEKKKRRREVKEKGKTSENRRTHGWTDQKEMLRAAVTEALQMAQSEQAWEEVLEAQNIRPYQRGGKLTGVICQGKKYRLRTLGVEKEFLQAEQRWQRQAALDDIQVEKARMNLRDFGFASGLLAVLAGQGGKGRRVQSLLDLFRAKRARKVVPSMTIEKL